MITLIFFFTCIILILSDQMVPKTLGNTILILISFYFGIRKNVAEVSVKKKEVGVVSSPKIKTKNGETAFNLPAKSVRFILFVGLMIIALKFMIQESEIYKPIPQFIIDAFIIITGFLCGTIYKKIASRLPSEISFISKIIFHGKALAVILLASTTSIYYIMDINDPNLALYAYVTNLIVGFYFGSR